MVKQKVVTNIVTLESQGVNQTKKGRERKKGRGKRLLTG